MKTGLHIAEGMMEGVQVLKLTGYLDGHTFIDLEHKLEQLFKIGKARLVMDLSGLTYIASAGVGAFINGQHQAKKHHGSLELANAGPHIKEIFDILGLDAIFTIHTTLTDAVRAARI